MLFCIPKGNADFLIGLMFFIPCDPATPRFWPTQIHPLTYLRCQCPLHAEAGRPLLERTVLARRGPLGLAPGSAGLGGSSGDWKTPGLAVGGCILGYRQSEGLG